LSRFDVEKGPVRRAVVQRRSAPPAVDCCSSSGCVHLAGRFRSRAALLLSVYKSAQKSRFENKHENHSSTEAQSNFQFSSRPKKDGIWSHISAATMRSQSFHALCWPHAFTSRQSPCTMKLGN
jgi:hypothetical protein